MKHVSFIFLTLISKVDKMFVLQVKLVQRMGVINYIYGETNEKEIFQ